jgi:alginate O-acetyltransferase complex protein AlgI
MLFNSEIYLIFLPVVVGINWALPARIRPAFLLLASYVFYAWWSAPFLLLVVGLTAVNYGIGWLQGRRPERDKRLLILAVVVNLGALAAFKYVGLLDETARSLAWVLGLPDVPVIHALLPLGLSFFAFEFIHYQFDVWKGGEPIVNPVRFALFPAFFPTQIAGPIKRYQDFDAQVRRRPRWDSVMALEGVELIALGLFKKVVLGDMFMRQAADPVFASLGSTTSIDVWIGMLAFYGQLYFDFSGYTDIGRGSAQLLGYRVPRNFDAPYLASSFQDFWRRWHMSLSSWIRDYIYFPLGGSRLGLARTRLNTLIAMALAGLWHGAAWHFVAFGLVGGAGILADRFLQRVLWSRRGLPPAVSLLGGWAFTQGVWLLMLAFFRAPTSIAAIWVWWKMVPLDLHRNVVTAFQLIDVPLILAALLLIQIGVRRFSPRELIADMRISLVLRPAYVTSLMSLFLFFFTFGATTRFIYFQF